MRVEFSRRTGGAATGGVVLVRSIRQRLILCSGTTNARRLPRRATAGAKTLSALDVTTRGVPPVTGIRQRRPPTPSDEKRISRPSGVQAIEFASPANQRGGPPSTGMRYMLPTPLAIHRINASVIPSGDGAGLVSPRDPAGGEVRGRCCPVSTVTSES